MKSSIFINLLLLCASFSYCQKAKKVKSELNFGIGLSQPDMRLDFLGGGWGAAQIRENAIANRPWFEYDIFLNYNRKVIGNDRFKLFGGMGYLLNINKVKIPVNNAYFTDPVLDPFLILITNKRYFKHSLHVPIEGRYHIKNDKMMSFAITIGILNNISILKKINQGSYLSDFKFEAAETELYTGIRYEKGNWGYYLQYRLINVQYKDDALWNNGKDVDYYNPVKFRMGVSRWL